MIDKNISSLFRKILSSSRKIFLEKVFNTLHNDLPFEDNWHIDLILEYLRAVEEGKIKRLIINIPPRSLKSVCISVFWPIWLLAHNPALKIITASYSKGLSLKHSQDTRFVMLSDWFLEYFPDARIIPGCNTQAKFMTKDKGFRFATSVGGTLTGEGADFIIVDDPQTPLQAFSTKEREKTIRWFEQTLMSRLNDKHKGAIILVMQRLHVNDLTGYLIQKGGWELLNIPMIANEKTEINFADFSYVREKGELLNKKRDTKEIVERLKNELGEYGFASQYQQKPMSINSQFIKKSWIRRYDHQMDISIMNSMAIYQSWDCAIKDGSGNDYTVCATIGELNDKYYLLDIMREKLAYPYLKNKIIEMYKKYTPNYVIIEDKASGQQIIQENINNNIPIRPFIPQYNKLTRLVLVTPIIESGNFLIPDILKRDGKINWVEDFLDELLLFPNGQHDDQVDAVTQGLQWIIMQKRLNSQRINPNISVL